MTSNYLFVGTTIHCNASSDLDIVENGYLYVVNNRIVYRGNVQPDVQNGTHIIKLTETQFLIPGFIDTHIHAPQYSNVGLGYDGELIEWLHKYTFPAEAEFENINHANEIYRQVIRRTLQSGTTTACYYGTSHLQSNLKLVEIAIELGQRCYVGHVNTVPSTSEFSIAEAINDTEYFIQDTLAQKSELVKPIVTPRSLLTCSMEMMQELAKLAGKYNLKIQTHLSENLVANQKILDQYPDAKSCTHLLEEAGILTDNTLLAHCVHLKENEKKLLVKYDSAISHCPQSNTYLHSGLCDVRDLAEYGLKCSLGTDIAGGATSSIIETMRAALQTANHIDCYRSKEGLKWLTYADVFFLATLGGAKALNLDDRIGSFNVGNELDALLVESNTGCIDLNKLCPAEEMLQKFIYLGDDRNIKKVFVASKCVL